ncbi:MAG: ATP-dependent sacrificial sulfur transferase LarE [Thermincola sp.]|jgi:uncharacterized protein|nr:ATP-dependent sacrificial sulfur transferase LarE [Thermincola sp.]MDT3701957.1 ATP-dependent sacrificial sulfur transferase LarE [Thermincola sp.]
MTSKKLEHLKRILTDMKSVLVAYSGGIDSTFLVKIASDVLGPSKVLAVTGSSETYTAEEAESAAIIAQSLGAKQRVIETNELENELFVQNPPDRCYHCKMELFTQLWNIAREQNLAFVVDGANADDLRDFRPGLKASEELAVRHPLQEAELTKEEIRLLARESGLPNWNKPSMPCLSSRFPYGHTIEPAKLRQVEESERFLQSLGFFECRVRHHGDIARIEVPQKNFAEIISNPLCQKITAKLKSLGFAYITVDLQGFRSGSMNEVLAKEIING